jgi:transcription elongation factor GreA
MTRPLVDALAAAGREKELVAHYVSLVARPARNPTLFVQLADRVELGMLDGDLPAPQQRAQCLLQLAVQVNRAATGNATMTRVRARLSSLLLRGDPPVLKRLLADASIDTLRGFASMIEGGVDRPVDQLFTKIAIERSPEVFRGEDKPFWQTGGTWTTRRGLARREAELRELKDVKIPANSEAIGKAAAYGDLSENSEWEAAIEEQRILTGRAMEIESEVRDAQLLENASIPERLVAPGTRVTYREVSNGRERKISVLGPWDGQGQDDVVSYRSPLAAGMLGHGPGERVIVQLPNGQLDVEVLAIEILDLD